MRRTIAPSFSQTSLRELEPALKRYSIKLMDAITEIANQDNGVVDMNDWFNRLSFDVPS